MVSVANTTSSAAGAGAAITVSKGNDSGSGGGAHPPALPTHTISAKVRKMIQSIKEIVGNEFSDTEVYLVLKETNMDPNESTQKLLNQDPFREVKRRNRKKEPQSIGHRNSEDSRKNSENISQETKVRAVIDRGARHGGGYIRTALPGNGGINKEFRVVRDNRLTLSSSKDSKPGLSPSGYGQGAPGAFEKGCTATSGISKLPGANNYSQSSSSSVPNDVPPRLTKDTHLSAIQRKTLVDERRTAIPSAASRVQNVKPSSSKHTMSLSNSVIGVYSSSTDPIHVPSPDSRPSAAVGAIKRDVGVVGGRRQSSETGGKDSSTKSFSGPVLGRDHSLSESFRPFTIVKSDQAGQTGANEPVISNTSVNRPLSRQHSGKMHQVVGHQKTALHHKEWKPKSSQKSSAISSGVIGTSSKSTSAAADKSKDLNPTGIDLPDKLSRVNIYENQNVIIAQDIRVPETDKVRLTFGSFGVEVDSSMSLASELQVAGDIVGPSSKAVPSMSVSPPEDSIEDTSASEKVEMLDDQVRNSGSNSPVVSENQVPNKSSSPPNLDNYADIGLVHDSGPSYDPSEPQQQHDPPELQNFSVYDPQAGYDISYFRPDGTIRSQGLPSPQEALNPHAANNNPASTISMVQQQQQQQQAMAQMYPQVHVSHYPNMMPYRQIISPMYVPQMPMPGYSSNPGYPHPSNGNSYLLMPGGSSHLSANGLKYGIQQFKPVPGGNPTGYGNFSNPTGYAINGPGVVGSGTGLEDSSRIKYKDGSLYVPNPQAETSEIWVQNPRDIPGLQSSAYYNMPAQTPHAAYLPSHTNHASFNAAAQSSHMQFSGLYPAPQAAAMANPHHLGAVMGGNVGVAPTPAQAHVGAYQQTQLGHLNWTTNF